MKAVTPHWLDGALLLVVFEGWVLLVFILLSTCAGLNPLTMQPDPLWVLGRDSWFEWKAK